VKKNRELAGMPVSDVQPSIPVNPAATSKVDMAVNDAIKKFNALPQEETALRNLLSPSTEQKLLGIKTDWVGALNRYDNLTPAERSARFSNPDAIRKVIEPLAKRQRQLDIAKKVALGGAGVASVEAAHEMLK
jgi:hypothetical protein